MRSLDPWRRSADARQGPSWRGAAVCALAFWLVACAGPAAKESAGDAGPLAAGDGADAADAGEVAVDPDAADTADADTADAAANEDISAADADAADAGLGGGAGVDPIAWGQGPLPALDRPLATGLATDVTLTACVAAAFAAGAADSVGPALANGSIALPAAGAAAYGKTWQAAEANAGHEFPSVGIPQGTAWLLCRVSLSAPTRLVAQVDRSYELRWPGHRLPADVYGSGRMRLPLRLAAGEHVLGVRGRGGQKVRWRLWTAPTALQLAPSDLTQPDLRVGNKDPLWVGMPLLEIDGIFSTDVRARVVESPHFHASEVGWPGLGPGAAVQIGWKLVPKAAPTATTDGKNAEGKDKPLLWPVTLEVASAAHPEAVRLKIDLAVQGGEQPFRQTFRDATDASVQYYGVRPPRDFDANKKDYGLLLSLHGAGVEGIGQAAAYGAKTWLWHVAPTNRRPFGFDWEEWGKWNGLRALDDAIARFQPDLQKIWLGGHSMGGHGTWQFAVHHSGRFAVAGPSAGWDSFYTYGGSPKPKGVVGRARAHSDTSKYLENLADRGVYVIHGTADDNVPWSEGKALHQKVSQFSKDVHHHWQDGAGHWWDGPLAEGADCIDWPPLFALMQERPLDPFELSFRRLSPGPYYSADHSYLRLDQAWTAMLDVQAESIFDGAALKLTLRNVRRARVDGAALRKRGLTELQWRSADAAGVLGGWQTAALPEGPLDLGPAGGKRVGQSGPFNQVFQRAFAIIVADDDVASRRLAAYWVTSWQQIGNGHATVLPASQAAHAIAAGRNLVWFGVRPTLAIADAAGAPLPVGKLPVDVQLPGEAGASPDGPTVAGATFAGAAVLSVYPRGAGVDAVLWAPADKLGLLMAAMPFSSRSGLPDFVVWDTSGQRAAGFWGFDWAVDPAQTEGL